MKKYDREQEFINLYNQTSEFKRRVYDNFGNTEITLMNKLKDGIEWAWQNLESEYADGDLFDKYTDNGKEYDPTEEDQLFILDYILEHDFVTSAEENPEFEEENLKELYDYIYEVDTKKVEKVCLKLLKKDDNADARKFLLGKLKHDTYRDMFGYFEIESYAKEGFIKTLTLFIEDRTPGDGRDYYDLY